MRKMATIQKILSITAIPDADAIVAAQINGWRVVVKKEEFEVGDLVVYCEVDSWIPTNIAPFLSKEKEPREYLGIKGEKLRTIRLRKQLSQGLILPLSVLGPIENTFAINDSSIGADVSEQLGIVKYDPPVPADLAGLVKGGWPSQIPKTDEERIQNLTSEWDQLRKFDYEVTEKLEGSSMTVSLIDSEFQVCSRNINLKETPGNTFWAMARKYDIEAKMRQYGLDNFAIQGEVIGEGIQGNHYDIKGQEFYVFSMYDIVKGEYVSPMRRKDITSGLNLKHAPFIGVFPLQVLDTILGQPDQITNVLDYANGKSALVDKLREGVVFKRVDGPEHFKAVSNEYLLKYKK